MHTVKSGLEKPALICLLIAIVYAAVFWGVLRNAPLAEREQAAYGVIQKFSESTFPPKIALVRELPDWGHVGYYTLMGRLFKAVQGEIAALRLAGLMLTLAAFFLFIRLGFRFTYRNRLNPLWISVALLLFAANPYSIGSAFHLGYLSMLMPLLLAAMLSFERSEIGWSAVFSSAAVLVDWRALLLAVSFLITRITGEQSRLLRPERMAAFLLPFVIGARPLIAWQGLVPQGEARDWWHRFQEHAPAFRIDGLFYCMVLLPVYGLNFAWAWALRARSRALTLGAIGAALCIPLYFVFPIHFDYWSEASGVQEVALGWLDRGALLVAGPYKNLVLFVPWCAGAFLFVQLLLMDVLDRSRWLRYFLILFFAVQPLVIGVGDAEFLMVVPFISLLSLSEALVGEEGKLA